MKAGTGYFANKWMANDANWGMGLFPVGSNPRQGATNPSDGTPRRVRVVTIIDIALIKIIDARFHASNIRGLYVAGALINLQRCRRTVPFPIERRGTERSSSDNQQSWVNHEARDGAGSPA